MKKPRSIIVKSGASSTTYTKKSTTGDYRRSDGVTKSYGQILASKKK